VKQLEPLVATLACCGVKLLVVGALLIPAGFLTSNRRRRQRALGKLTPVEFELAFTDQAAAVAA
jgi:hypothetical protein